MGVIFLRNIVGIRVEIFAVYDRAVFVGYAVDVNSGVRPRDFGSKAVAPRVLRGAEDRDGKSSA